MRIGIVTGEYPPMQGGVGAYTRILAHQFSDNGHYLSLFSSTQAHSDTFPIHYTTDNWGFSSLRAIQQWATQQQLDVVNLQFQTAAYGMSPWIHFLPDVVRHVPVITTFHDLRFPYLFPKAGPLRNWIVMHLARRSAGVIVTNHEDAQGVQNLPHTLLIPISSNILQLLPANTNAHVWREKAGASANDFLIAYFGLINRSKGLETLLKSLHRLRKENVPGRLLIVGGVAGSSDATNIAYLEEIDALIAQLGLNDYVRRTGFLEDDNAVGSYLSASDVVVLPFNDGASFRRGSLMAAIHYGCAVVTTIPRVHVPLFVHGENMLLVPPQNDDALTTALRQLYNTPEMMQHLRQGAAKLATHFDWQHIANDYLDFFQSVVGK